VDSFVLFVASFTVTSIVAIEEKILYLFEMNYITNMSQKERIFLDSSVIIGLFSGGNLTVISGWKCGNIWLAYPRN
jgi:hypothetical protein